MLGGLGFCLTALEELLNTFIDQDLSELVFGRFDIELIFREEGILECFIIVVEVEVELGKEVGNEGSIGEGLIFIEGLDEIDVVGDINPVQRDVRKQLLYSQLLQVIVVLLQ